MTDARAVAGLDRLPWLTDEPRTREQLSRPKSGARELLGWALAGILFIAGISYWMGVESGRIGERKPIASSAEAPASTVKLPEARATAPEASMVPESEVNAPPVPTVSSPETRARKLARPSRASSSRRKLSPMRMDDSELAETVARQRAEPKQSTAARAQPRLWPATESKGASGRVVRIGAFGSRQQAKLGWRRMQRAYPAVGRLPATVVTDRNSRGRIFYRFQIGTTSQAHSEVLCQRMEKMLRFSCAVVGLPWKANVER
jgi:hypothetical protein